MKHLVIAMAGLMAASQAGAAEPRDYKQRAAIWYSAFSAHDPQLLGSVLDEHWYETPSEDRGGREVGMKLLVALTTTFPDFKIEIKDMIQEGNKVVVRSEITGTQAGVFMGFEPKNRKISIQAIDIHEFKDDKIVRTWHSEDWLTGLRQMGVFQK
jgi:predicted ester cyclase